MLPCACGRGRPLRAERRPGVQSFWHYYHGSLSCHASKSCFVSLRRQVSATRACVCSIHKTMVQSTTTAPAIRWFKPLKRPSPLIMSSNAIDGLLAWLANPNSVEGRAWKVQVQQAISQEPLGVHLLQVSQTPSSHFTTHAKQDADLSYDDWTGVETARSEQDAWQFIRQFPFELGHHLFYYSLTRAPPEGLKWLGVHVTTDSRFAERLGALSQQSSFERYLSMHAAMRDYCANCGHGAPRSRCFLY